MSITFPVDIITDFPGWSTRFEIDWQQQFSMTRGGRTIVKEIAPARWRAAYRSRSMRPNELDAWRARLDVLENGMTTFRGFHKARCYPIADPNGTIIGATPTLTISAIGVDNKTVKIDGFPPGYVLSVGDMVSYETSAPERFLHRIVAGGTADAGGETGWLEVRPWLAYGLELGDAVTVLKPWVPMCIVPGSISTDADAATGRGTVGFEAMEAR